MGSFYAELTVGGETYSLRQCHYDFNQATDQRGRAAAKVRHGQLHLTLDVPTSAGLLVWAAAPHKPLGGHVTFFADAQRTALETLSFDEGHCIHYHEHFHAGDASQGAYVCQLTIVATKLTLTPGAKPGSFVAPAPREVAVSKQAPATSIVAAPTPAPPVAPRPWLTDVATVMGPDVDVATAVDGWVKGGLSENKLASALRGSVDKRLVFERLGEAKKGIYEHRVIIDDYDNIPGVVKKPHKRNSLPEKSIPASNFGVNNPDFDLPAFNATTFSDRAELREIKPGEKLYRVACDPKTDPRGMTGAYWTRTPPADLQEVIGGTAVMPEWNNYQRVYEFTAPPYADPDKQEPKFFVWEGPAASQPVSGLYSDKENNGYCLPGGASQVYINKCLAWNPDFATHIIDVTSTHKSW